MLLVCAKLGSTYFFTDHTEVKLALIYLLCFLFLNLLISQHVNQTALELLGSRFVFSFDGARLVLSFSLHAKLS